MSAKPKLTQPLRPAARYRKGQAPANLPLSDSDEDEQQPEQPEQQDEPLSDNDQYQAGTAARVGGTGAGRHMKVSLREVEVDQRGQVRVGGRTEVGRTAEESSEEESEDEEEAVPRPGFTGTGPSKTAGGDEVSRVQMTFSAEAEAGLTLSTPGRSLRANTRLIQKRKKHPSRFTSQCSSQSKPHVAARRFLRPAVAAPLVRADRLSSSRRRNRDTIAERNKELDPEVIEARREAEAEERRKQAHDLVAQSITRELAASKPNPSSVWGLSNPLDRLTIMVCCCRGCPRCEARR